ncbi:DMT family transporter [uncultured Cardiobacterium sp.]|uniref:DMT family transporter n=1 Tax=uncultured Cardiobacterium sp. TaxID=417619 RepID=UPI002633C852|nr:DMT family transporter [uncultured Cardiobacterium sp.]
MTANIRCHLQLIAMALLWGATWSWGRAVVQTLPPLTAAALRLLLATVPLTLWLLYREGRAPLMQLNARQWLGLTAAAACGVCGYAVFFMLALQYVPAGKAATVVALNPVPPLLLAAWLFKEKLNGGILCGMVLAVLGALTAIARGNPLAVFAGGVGVGEYLLLATVLCWTGYALIGRVLLRGISPLTTTTITVLIGAVMLLALALAFDGSAFRQQALNAPARTWGILAALALGGTMLCYLWYFDGIRHLGVGTATSYMALVPVFGIAIATLWLHEPLHASLLVGGTMVVAGMWLMNYAGRR